MFLRKGGSTEIRVWASVSGNELGTRGGYCRISTDSDRQANLCLVERWRLKARHRHGPAVRLNV